MLVQGMVFKNGRVVTRDAASDNVKKEFMVQGCDKATAALVKLFTGEKAIDDYSNIHALANELGIPADKLEEKVYAILQSFFSQGRFNIQRSQG